MLGRVGVHFAPVERHTADLGLTAFWRMVIASRAETSLGPVALPVARGITETLTAHFFHASVLIGYHAET